MKRAEQLSIRGFVSGAKVCMQPEQDLRGTPNRRNIILAWQPSIIVHWK